MEEDRLLKKRKRIKERKERIRQNKREKEKHKKEWAIRVFSLDAVKRHDVDVGDSQEKKKRRRKET